MSSNESVNLNDTVRFGIATFHPSGGALTNADATPRWQVYEDATDTPILEGSFVKRTIAGAVPGNYRGTFNATEANGFGTGQYYEVFASGMVDGVNAISPIKTFVLDNNYKADIVAVSGQAQYAPGGFLQVNVMEVSGVPVQLAEIVDANVIQVSGNYVSIEDFRLEADVYYADVKFLKDKSNSRDEYNVSWFRNAQPLGSGDVSGPRINVVKTSDGTDLIADRTLTYTSPIHGALRHNEAVNTAVAASGEAYLVHVSGVIDAEYHQWTKLVGIDELY